MDRDIVEEMAQCNQASIALLTLMLKDDQCHEASELVAEDDIYAHKTTMMAMAGIALGAISALAEHLQIEPQEIVQHAGLNAARLHEDLRRQIGE